MVSSELQLAPMHRILKKAGAERVSEKAADALRKVLEEIGVMIAKDALDFAAHAGRKTVKDADIEIAYRKIFRERLI